MKRLAFAMLMSLTLFSAVTVHSALKSEMVEYKHGELLLQGYLVYDDALRGKRPGVLVVHEWWGINDFTKKRTEQVAALGYVAFAIDMYGKGVRPSDAREARDLATLYRNDRKLMRSRAIAGLEFLKKHPRVDGTMIAAVGFCFGGTVVLEMARSGAELRGVVSFHGGLDTPQPADAKQIKGKVLVLHGADDPFVSKEQVLAFQEEMRKGGVDWQMIFYGGAVHSFTNPNAGNDPSKGAAYHEKADTRSWEAMSAFLEEVFEE